MKTFLLMRKLGTAGGNALSYIVGVHETKEEAEAQSKKMDGLVTDIMQQAVVRMLPNGNAEAIAPVGKVLADLGVVGVGHYVVEVESHGKLVVPDEKRILVARN